MATLTKQQVQKINDKCKAGFCLDLRYFAFHREKQLIKTVAVSDTEAIVYTLGFHTHYVHFSPINTIAITRAEWVKNGATDVWTNSSGWDTITLQKDLPKKMFNKVIDIENSLAEKDLEELFKNKDLLDARVVDKNGMIVF